MATVQNSLRSRRRSAAFLLLLPTMIIIVGFFVYPMARFFRYAFFSVERGKIIEAFTLDTIRRFFSDPFYVNATVVSLKNAAVATVFAVLIGFVAAYAYCKVKTPVYRQLVNAVLFMPLVVSVVVMSFGYLTLLGGSGIVNFVLLKLGIIREPLRLVYNELAVRIALVHTNMPFMVFPIISALEQIKPSFKEAATDLGAGWLTTFVRVTLPLSVHGVIGGIRLFFTLCLGAFVVPFLLGGGRVNPIPGVIYYDMLSMNWPQAAVSGFFLLAFCVLLLAALDRLARRFTYLK